MLDSHHGTNLSIVFVAQRTQTCIQVKLGDFGLARFDTDDSFTYVGTINWLAPVSLTYHIGKMLNAPPADFFSIDRSNAAAMTTRTETGAQH